MPTFAYIPDFSSLCTSVEPASANDCALGRLRVRDRLKAELQTMHRAAKEIALDESLEFRVYAVLI
jgi:hypothetical protein